MGETLKINVCLMFPPLLFSMWSSVLLDVTEHIVLLTLPLDYKEGVNPVVCCVIQCDICPALSK